MTSSADLLALLRRLQVIEDGAPVTGGGAASAEAAGAAWVAQGLLTRFQLDALLHGKGDRLRIGPYLLLDRLGAGGMGEVFRARHVRLGREVALKLIRQDKLESETATARFLRELRATARVEHPNVVRVFNAGRDPRHFYFSMEYVRGASLAEAVRRGGPMPVADACRAVGDAALGLEAVHAAGLVHRDIKPANLVREDATGRTKVLDLGLAGLTVRPADDSAAGTLTQAGTVLGSPDYMAPEQALNPHAADHRCDLYSLGCTLAFLLAGRPVFPDCSPVEKLFKHAYAPPPDVRAARPDTPAELAAVVARLLAKNPADRFPSAAALTAALAPFAAPTPTAAVATVLGEEFETIDERFVFESPAAAAHEPAAEPAGRTRRRWRPRAVAGGAVALIAAAVLFIKLAGRPADSPTFTAGPVPVAPDDRLTALRAALGRPGADVPKARAELYALHAEHRGGPLGVPVARALRAAPSPLDDLPPLDPGPGKPPLVARRVPPGPRHWGPAHAVAVSPNRQLVATAGADRLVRLWSADTGKPVRALAGFDDPVNDVTFSPDGARVAAASGLVSANGGEGFERKARVWDAATGELLLTAGQGLDWVVSWRFDPTGGTALAGSYDLLRVRSAADGKERTALRGKAGGTNWVMRAEFSRDGTHALAACNDFHVHVWNVATGEEVRAWKAAGWYFDGFDASRADDAVLTVAEGRVRVWDWTTGKKLSDLPFIPPPTRAAFSPDGKRLLAGGQDGGVRLIDRKADRPGEAAAGHDGPVTGLAWAGDARAYSVGRDGTLRRWDVSGDRPVELDPPPAVRPAAALAFTDDDRTVVVARPGQPPEVWSVAGPAPPAGPVAPPEDPAPVAVSPDGRRVAAVRGGGASYRVWSLPDGGVREFDEGTGAPLAALAWFPDSYRLLTGPRDPRADLTVRDAASGRISARLPPGREGLDGPLAVAADGRWAVAGLRNGDIGWWDLAAGTAAGQIPRPHPQSALAGLVFTPTHRHLRAFGAGWQATESAVGATRAGRLVWEGESAAAGGAMSPDGERTAVATKTGEVIVLTETGKRLREWTLPGRVTGLAFSANGRYLAAAHADGGVGVYRVP